MKRVLIVNDCKFESLIIKDHLLDIGYSVETANEYDALVRVREFDPDVVIANLIMKNTTGDKLVSRIKSKNPNIICILSSCDYIKLDDYIKNKVSEVIHTPVSKSHLLEILDRTLIKHEEQNSYNSNIDDIFKRLESKNNENRGYALHNKMTSQQKFSFCPYCGCKLDEANCNFSYCPYCGQKLES